MDPAQKIGYGIVLGIGLATGLAIARYVPAPAPIDLHADDVLRSRVDVSLALHRALHPFAFSVESERGKVVLRGSVDNPLERQLAQRIAGGVDGVNAVDNRITVEPHRARWLGHTAMVGDARDDRALALAVRAQLRWHRVTRGSHIDVSSQLGHVVLRGSVKSLKERDSAQRIATRTEGVRAVDNQIYVRGRATDRGLALLGDAGRNLGDMWITAQVKSALLYESDVSGLDLRVRTRDGVVLLSGVAANRTELDLAGEIAATVRGVRRVDTRDVTLST
jgi:osmotically-inducible protein OsmY